MTYATSTSPDANDVIAKIEAFALANGWTVNLSAALGANRRLHISKAGCYLNLATNQSAGQMLSVYASSGFNGSLAWNNQPGPSSTLYQCTNRSPCTNHFFAQGDFLACLFSSTTDSNTYLVAGVAEKIGAWTGGQFVGAGDALVGTSPGGLSGTAAQAGWLNMDMLIAGAWVQMQAVGSSLLVDTRTALAPLMPVRLFQSITGGKKPRAVLPWVRVAARAYVNGTEITYGTDVWKIFYGAGPTSERMVAFLK
jgi:hypothetical protein